MHLQRYPYNRAKNYLEYEFVSVVNKGTVLKRVTFTRLSAFWYNLSFGDLDIESRKANDDLVTNNGGSDIILATVAAIVKDFILRNKGMAIVVAIGLDDVRNRL